MPRGDRQAWGGPRISGPDAKPPGRPRTFERIRLHPADRALLASVLDGMPLDEALRRIAASAAADHAATHAALAPLIAVAAWNEDIL